MNLSFLFVQIIDFSYSLLFCLRIFPIKDALKVPVNISHRVKVGNVQKNCIKIQCPVKRNLVIIGHQGYSAIEDHRGLINFENGSQLIINGRTRFAQGIRLWIEENAKVTIGDDFYCNKNCLIRAYDDITIGRGALWGWNVELNNSDGHQLFIDGEPKNNHGSIEIGDNVWISSHVSIGKNAGVSSGSVVASHSLVISRFKESNILVGGIPAKLLKSNVSWKC